jgi:membrane-associated phospholipid phosphatase
MSEFAFRIEKKRVGIQFAIIAVIYAVLFIITFAVGDLNLTIAINQLMVASPPWLQSLMFYYTRYGYYVFGVAAIGIGVLTFFTDKFEKLKPYRIMFLGLAVGYSASWFVMAYLLKPVIMRLRPYQEYPTLFTQYEYKPGSLYESGGYSFPSGHATASFGMSGAMMVRVQKWVFRILLYVYPVLMAFTRPFFGVHYVTDVLVGSILGLACSIGFYVLFEYLNSKGKLPTSRQRVIFLIGLAVAVLSIIIDILE